MTLRVAPDLELPDDVVTQSIAILARRGAGKTYTGSVLVEEAVRASLPVVVLDPTGAWWGLRSSVDGQKAGLPVVIFGGDHADVPLEPTAGKVIADVVVDHPGAYIVDLSAFTSKAAEQRFAGEFLEQLYRAKRRESGPLLVVVDEADVFAPQRPGPEQTRTLGALESIVRRGRIKGLGDLLITQRAAVLNKNVLTQTEVLVVMQTTGPQDRAAIDAWIEGNGTKEERAEVLGSLASLERGEAWVWSPSFLRILQRVRIRARTTFDSSRTPEAGETAVTARAFAKVDLAALGERIAATVEQQKANDPGELRRRIATLEGTVETMRAANRNWEDIATRAEREQRVERIEVPVLNGELGQLRDLLGELQEVGTAIERVGFRIFEVGRDLSAAISRVHEPRPHEAGQEERGPRGVQGSPAGDRGQTPVATLAPAAPSRKPAPVSDESVSLGKAERSILAGLAQYPIALSRTQLAFVAGYHARSKGFTNALGTLRSAALITPDFPEELTPAGRAIAPEAAAPDLAEYWLSRFGRAEQAILRSLIALYPADGSRESLAANAGFEHIRSKGFTNALGRLRGLGLVDGLRLSDGFAQLLWRA